MPKTKDREVKMSWEALAEALRKSGILLGKEEVINNITLTKPKQMVFRLERRNEEEKRNVAE